MGLSLLVGPSIELLESMFKLFFLAKLGMWYYAHFLFLTE